VALRIVTYLFAVGSFSVHHRDYVRPWLGWVVLGVMTVWTVVVIYCYSRDSGRRPAVVVTDVVLTNVLISLSAFVLSPEQLTRPAPLVTTIWAPGCVVAAGVLGGHFAGTLVGGAVALSSYLVRGYFNTDIARDTMLLLGVGFVVGLAASTARHSAEQVARALRAEAASAERERLARAVHDSVLQVLARVRRRGAELGGEAAELARLAGEQEVALRALVASAPSDPPGTSDADDEVDLCPRLQVLASSRFQVSVPATPVPLPAGVVDELCAVVKEALANVEKHAGPDARAWVLLEDLGDEVVLSVRDDGPGIPPGRLDAAEAEGRMGVSRSIRGRITDLGGRAILLSEPGEGVEWEFRLPRPAAQRGRRKGAAR